MKIELSMSDLEMLGIALARNLQPVFSKADQQDLVDRIRAARIDVIITSQEVPS